MNIHEALTTLEVMPQRERGHCSPPWGAAENTCVITSQCSDCK